MTWLLEQTNEVFLSAASAWEMQIKLQLVKLLPPGTVPELIGEEVRANGFLLLPVTVEHVYALAALPSHH